MEDGAEHREDELARHRRGVALVLSNDLDPPRCFGVSATRLYSPRFSGPQLSGCIPASFLPRFGSNSVMSKAAWLKKAVYVVIGVSSEAVAKLMASCLAANRSQAPRAQGFGSE